MSVVDEVLKRFDNLKVARQNWDEQFQVVGEYVSQNKQSFQEEHQAGEFLNEQIFDSTATFAAQNASSALLGMLWPSSAKNSVRIEAPDDFEELSADEKDWYERATDQLVKRMDDPESNLYMSLDEYMLDDVTFGTSGVGVFWEKERFMFRPYGVSECSIDEGADGRVDTVYCLQKWGVNRVVETYGIENVSKEVRDKFEKQKFNDLIEILIAYEKRREVDETKEGFLNFPYRSVHVEKKSKTLLREGGFETFPIMVNRFKKLSYEKYGRSPAMNALPDIRELNVLREAVIAVTEKTIYPSLGVMNDGILGNGVVDTSAGAITVFDGQGSQGNPPVFEIAPAGDLNPALGRIEDLTNNIAQHFFIDRLLDFNNQTQMTATESTQRMAIRAASLSSLLSRQIAEVFLPLVDRCVFLLFKHDVLGILPEDAIEGDNRPIIPERIAERIRSGEESYKVRFLTAADRASKAEELQGSIQYIQFMQGMAQTNPDVLLSIDDDAVPVVFKGLFGASDDLVLSSDEVEEKKAQLQAQQEQAQGLAQAQALAQTAETAANAEKTASEV